MDLHLAILQLGKNNNEYAVSKDPPPHTLIEWRGPDPQPTEDELKTAWETYLSNNPDYGNEPV